MSGQEAATARSDRETDSPPGLTTDPELCRLLDYWREKRQGRAMPSKDNIDPLGIGWALSRIFLLDYSPEDGFRYRLAGNEIARVFDRANLKGLNLRDLVKPDRIDAVEQIWRQVVEARHVVCMKGMIYYGVDRTAIGERILLPLSDGATDEVTGLLGMTVCDWMAGIVPEEMKLARYSAIPATAIS
jgi:hypothetical protein